MACGVKNVLRGKRGTSKHLGREKKKPRLGTTAPYVPRGLPISVGPGPCPIYQVPSLPGVHHTKENLISSSPQWLSLRISQPAYPAPRTTMDCTVVLLHHNTTPLLYLRYTRTLWVSLKKISDKNQQKQVWLTYGGLLEEYIVVGCSQSIDGRHVDLVREGREDLGEENTTAVLVVRILGHLQRLLVVSGGKKEGEKKRVQRPWGSAV